MKKKYDVRPEVGERKKRSAKNPNLRSKPLSLRGTRSGELQSSEPSFRLGFFHGRAGREIADATRCRRCEPFRQHRRQAQDLPLPAWALFQLWYSHRLGTPPAASDFSAPALTWHIIRAGAGIRICSSVRRRRENSNLAAGGACGHTPPLLARLAKSKVGLGSVPAARPPHGCLCL